MFSSLIGVVVGGGLSTGTVLLYRSQRRDAVDAERRAREIAATSRIEDALIAMLGLERGPRELMQLEEEPRYREGESLDDLPLDPEPASLDEWNQWRSDLLLAFETASMDLSIKALRSRLERAQLALLYPSGPWDSERQPESVTRKIVCRHSLECVGAFRRGEPLPAESNKFINTMGAADEWIEHEEYDRLEREALAKMQAALLKRAQEAQDTT